MKKEIASMIEIRHQRHLNRKVSVRPNGSLRLQTVNDEPTMTQQQFKDDCDINNILRKHGHDPVAFQALTRPGGVYADFSSITDYHTMLNEIVEAQTAFGALPAHLRARFDNDPGKLLAFIQDKKNRDEGVSLGIINPPTPTTNSPDPVPSPNPPNPVSKTNPS